MTSCAISMLNYDTLTVVCLNLRASQLACLGQTCKALNTHCTTFAEYFARDELNRLGIPYQGIPLTMRRLIEHLGTLPIATCKKIWDFLKSHKIVFYNLNSLRPAFFMLTPRVINIRESHKDKFNDTDARQITKRAVNDRLSVDKQFILACRTGDTSCVENFLRKSQFTAQFTLENILEILSSNTTSHSCKWVALCILKEKVPLETAIEISCSISDSTQMTEWAGRRALAIGTVASRDDIPLDVAVRLLDSIHDEQHDMSFEFRDLSLKKGVPLKKAWDIAKKITEESVLSSTLYTLALRALDERSWKEAHEIALTIPDVNKRSNALSRTSLELPRELKKEAVEVALSIPDPLAQSNTLYELAMNRRFSYADALEIVNLIPDPNIRQRAQSLIQVRLQAALSSLTMGAI